MLAEKCSIGQLEATGRGVIAQQDIACGEVVVEVPDDALILAETSPICKLLQGEKFLHLLHFDTITIGHNHKSGVQTLFERRTH